MAQKQPTRPPRPRRSAVAVPPVDASDLAAAKATLAALPEAALLTGEKWSDGGVEILFANTRFAALSGYTAAELAGRNTRILHGPRTDLLGPAHDAAAIAQRLLAGDGWLYRKNGEEFFGRWGFAPLLPGVQVAVYLDLSEVQRLQEALLHAQQLDTVGQLTSGVAHDFNNLLSIINGYGEILAAKLADAPAAIRKDLAEIQRAGVKAASIARQILEFSRRQEAEARVVNPNTLIREIAEMLRRAMGDAVQVELRLASDLGNTRIDPTRFQQALLNLCFNARDAMPGGGKLTVRTANHAVKEPTDRLRAGNYVRIEVSDTGEGFDEATRQRIFEPFFTTKSHGTGLGLPTVLRIIDQAEGAVNVRSAPGQGTSIDLLLPETAESPSIQSPLTASAPPPRRGTEQVWLVEADGVVRKMVSGILAVDGYRVREFSSITEAADVAETTEPPDLLLLDATSAGAAGLALRLAGRNARLKVLAVSVKSPASALAHLPPRAVGHLPKPFALSTLLRSVRDLLDRPVR